MQQAGVVNLWMMLNTIVSMDDIVITAFQEKVREFGEKDLRMYVDKKVETTSTEISTICTRLAEQNHLPKDSKDLVMKGLSKAEYTEFAKIFGDLVSAIKNSPMFGFLLKGTTLKQITQLFDEADKHYAALTTAKKWNAVGKHRAHSAQGTFPCDNGGKPGHKANK